MSPIAVSVDWTSLSSASSTWSLYVSFISGAVCDSLPGLFLPGRLCGFQTVHQLTASMFGAVRAYAARALSNSSLAVLTLALAFIANPIEVDRVACQGVRNRSTIKLSCANRASPT